MLCFLCGRIGLEPKLKNGNFYFDGLPIHRAPKHISCQQFFFSLKDNISMLHLVFTFISAISKANRKGHMNLSHVTNFTCDEFTRNNIFHMLKIHKSECFFLESATKLL